MKYADEEPPTHESPALPGEVWQVVGTVFADPFPERSPFVTLRAGDIVLVLGNRWAEGFKSYSIKVLFNEKIWEVSEINFTDGEYRTAHLKKIG